ncbi:ABC transporter substrate-binding protein [Pseudomonas daroniae]|uniref:ABC transporter substrate-binding protein n=1 Tax=Phytopseudomonas daroniae TaxID=2487519 RepID=A0A4Q9QHI8_9GAMM|nr:MULTISPECIES: ABC transporter substrate-binding protein [Pseudomonas]TBU73970.1 ABC transporter substrate-binding protein [Pseudomonas daroniae]TBU78034.1 ABC transporter substrate-binding protein [Pseudomonas sp. FRB 228]TBU88693.1 ABC transporter substrate-binding protein [Pseudomonas daroniae]
MLMSRFAVFTAALGLSSMALAASPTQYPLTIDNCGHALSFAAAPNNTVTIGQAGTEILYSLGVGERLAGTSLWFSNVLPEFKAQNDKVERLADNDPSFESVINKRPGLVAVQFEWMVGEQGVVGTREQFHKLKIPTYILPSDCEGKDNLVGADGTRLQPFQIESLYKGIHQLAEIFDVQGEGDKLVSNLQDRLGKAVAGVEQRQAKQISAAFWFSSADLDLDPYMAGQKGVADYMMKSLGLRNVVESSEEWPTVGWETLAKANPTVLVLARMDRRRFPADDVEKKLEFLRNDPVAKHMDAVKNGRIVILDADGMQASLRMIAGIETLAKAVDGFDIQK